MSQPSPTLWEGRVAGQVFAYELHSEYPRSGPGLVYSTLIPDVHHFRGSGGGRALPKLHPDGTPNVCSGVLEALTTLVKRPVSGADLFDYIAGIAGHAGFVAQFDDELHTPGVRIPLTRDPALWQRAVTLGRHLQWLQTYGEAGAHPDGYTDLRDPRINVTHPTYEVSVGKTMPRDWRYDEHSRALYVGSGRWDGVSVEAVEYTVGGSNVLSSWLNYRMAEPKKRYTSPLDRINAVHWDPRWSSELTNLLSILAQLVQLEDEMADLLSDVLASPLLTRDQLEQAGTVWPRNDKDRRPRLAVTSELIEESRVHDA